MFPFCFAQKPFKLFFLLFLLLSEPVYSQSYDLIISGGIVVKGDGTPALFTDIGIDGGRIVFLGDLEGAAAEKRIDARGLYVCPGFIDIHTHAGNGLLKIPGADNYLLQGVTSVVGGNCGSSVFPLVEMFDRLEEQRPAVNFASFVGHNTIRAMIMGRKTGSPDSREARLMRELIEQEMRSGAVGLSSGLTYFPGRHSTLRELIELAEVVALYGGLYSSHIRSEGRDVDLAVAEAIRIGEASGIKVQISHIKLIDPSVWGKPHLITNLIESARRRGLRITADVYPYTASSTSFSSLFPTWARSVIQPGAGKSSAYYRIKAGLARMFADGLERIAVAEYRANPAFEGKNFLQLLQHLNRPATPENAADLMIEIERSGNAQGIFFYMQEPDVETFLSLDYSMIGSDGSVIQRGRGKPHCRSYGTFPRILARYVRERKRLSLEEATRKMTFMPALTLGLSDRGLVSPGYWADLVVFDYYTIRDTATYSDPHQYPEGIWYVIVNGEIAAVKGKPTGRRSGRVLYGPGRRLP